MAVQGSAPGADEAFGKPLKANRSQLHRYQMNAQRIENRPLPYSSTRSAMVIAALLGLLTCGLTAWRPVEALAQAPAQSSESGSLELVDPDVFRPT
jgi:hypothetical protein